MYDPPTESSKSRSTKRYLAFTEAIDIKGNEVDVVLVINDVNHSGPEIVWEPVDHWNNLYNVYYPDQYFDVDRLKRYVGISSFNSTYLRSVDVKNIKYYEMSIETTETVKFAEVENVP